MQKRAVVPSVALFALIGAALTASLEPAHAKPGFTATPAPSASPVKVVATDGITTLTVYPAIDPTTSQPYLAGAERPAILVVPGWDCTPSEYTQLGAFLAGRGYVCAILDHDGNTDELPDTWTVYTETALDTLVAEAVNPLSPLFHEIDPTKIGLVGHSIGGATATLVASTDKRISAVALFAPQSGDTTFLSAAYLITAPLLTVDGSLDHTAPYASCSAVVVAHAASADKASVVVTGGNHQNSPADFDLDYVIGPGQWVMEPLGYYPFFTWEYTWPKIPGLTPIPGATQRAIGYPYLGGWMDRFLTGAKDPNGWTTGKQADAQVASGVLTTDVWSASARKAP